VDFRPIVNKIAQWYRYHQRNRTEQQRSSQHTEQPIQQQRTTITLPTQLFLARHPCSTHSRRRSIAPVITAPTQHNIAVPAQHNIAAALQHYITAASQHNIAVPAQHNNTLAP
jgi:hypothetical protein